MAAIRYIVSDVPRAVAFYTANLGFTVKKQVGAAIANVARDDLSLWLSGPESSAGAWSPVPVERKSWWKIPTATRSSYSRAHRETLRDAITL